MSDRLPALYALRAFEAAARHRSFTLAARELSLTQSAVSRHIRTLEADFACRLFEREGRGLRLTDAGEQLLPGLTAGFTALQRACADLRGSEGVLRLKAPSTLTVRWLLACLSRFRQAHPTLDVQLTSAWMNVDRVDFQQEPFDCAVLLSDGQFPGDWHSVRLFEEWLIPVCAPSAVAAGPGIWRACARRNSCTRHRTAATGGAGWRPCSWKSRCRYRVASCSTCWNWASWPPRVVMACRLAICCWSPKTSRLAAWACPGRRRWPVVIATTWYGRAHDVASSASASWRRFSRPK